MSSISAATGTMITSHLIAIFIPMIAYLSQKLQPLAPPLAKYDKLKLITPKINEISISHFSILVIVFQLIPNFNIGVTPSVKTANIYNHENTGLALRRANQIVMETRLYNLCFCEVTR